MPMCSDTDPAQDATTAPCRPHSVTANSRGPTNRLPSAQNEHAEQAEPNTKPNSTRQSRRAEKMLINATKQASHFYSLINTGIKMLSIIFDISEQSCFPFSK